MRVFLALAVLMMSCAEALAFERFSQVEPGVYRGSQPLNKADFTQLKNLGIRTSIDLQWSDDGFRKEQTIAHQFGIETVHEPMSVVSYPNRSEVIQVLNLLRSPENRPVFVHCREGKDRTGLIVALYRIHVMGWSAKSAYDEMRAIGFNPYLVPLEAFFFLNSHAGDLSSWGESL